MLSMRGVVATAAATAIALAPGAAQAELDEREIQVVGTWSNLSQWSKYEQPFWQGLPESSGGRLTANAKPMDELGLSGFELMRQLELGVFDVVHTLASYSANDVPVAGGIDLAGLIQDREAYGKMIEAYRPVLDAEFRASYNARVLALYSFSSYSILCDLPDDRSVDDGIDALAGLKIRSHSISMGDLIEGLGGTAVTLPFAEVVPSMQQGVVDCGVTGVLSGYEAKWHQVTDSYLGVPLGFGTVVVAANLDFWNSLSPDTQAHLEAQFANLEAEVTAGSVAEDEMGIACYGAGPCPLGEPGNNAVIALDDEDRAKLAGVVRSVVLTRFAERCGADCTRQWNETVGAALGVTAGE
jgi:TRAP-type C4-dicarboxylate transport system substrate-binding protein